jgi:hypothetical protein
MEVEHQNRRSNRENAVAERCDTADLFTGQSVIVRLHEPTIALLSKRVNRARLFDLKASRSEDRRQISK